MRNLLFFTIALLGFTTTNAQGSEFKYSIKGKQQVINDYVVIEKKGTAKELYEYTLDWINKNYVSPDDVITVNDEEGYIRVNGYVSGIKSPITIGFRPLVDVSGKYTLVFRFKDNKIKFELQSFKHSTKVYTGTILGTTNISLDYKAFGVTNSSGRKIKPKKVALGRNIAEYFNLLVKSLVYHDLSESLENDW